MRWHPLVLRFALNLKYVSTSAYHAVRESGIIKLPLERTLSDYTHWTSAHSGVQVEFVQVFKEMLNHDLASADQHYCAISMDEMKIKAGLVFSKRNGHLVGFIDIGTANQDIERFLALVVVLTLLTVGGLLIRCWYSWPGLCSILLLVFQ